MKKQAMLRAAFFNPRGLISLFVTSTGVCLTLLGFGAFSNASALTPIGNRNPVAKANTHVVRIDNREITPPGDPNPMVTNVTLVTGPDTGVSGPSGAAVRIADLDHGLVAGNMKYSYQGINLSDTIAPFRWSEEDGGATLFHVPDEVVFDRSFYFSNGMTPDGSKVVGSVLFRDSLTTAPWFATRDGGWAIQFLEVPDGLGGGAVAVSNDGQLVAGIIVGSFGSAPGQAVVWRDGTLEALATDQVWSEVGSQFEQTQPFPQRAMNGDGSVIIGASGPSSDHMQATRWVDGVEQKLSIGVAVQSSVAIFVADNGMTFGTATLSDGHQLLVRWDNGGKPDILEPPSGFGVVNVTSIDTLGAAAGGWVAERTGCASPSEPACSQSPFVWTARDGFTILPKLDLDDYYNLSTVNSVSDDGQVAVGSLIPGTQSEGDPPAVGFVWTADSGLVVVNDLMAATGQPNPDYYSAAFVSRDGNRILVTGNPPQATERDTNSLILDLAWSAPRVIGAASSKVHGTAGAFSVSLPLTGPAGIECRAGGATNDYSMVVTFANPVTVMGSPQAQVTSGTAEVGSGGVANGGAVTVAGAVVTVPLTNVGNAQRITVMLSGVSDGTNVRDVSIPMSLLVGDTGADGAVNASDVSQTKAQSGQAITGGNFREDVNADGSISASDISLVKAQSGTALP